MFAVYEKNLANEKIVLKAIFNSLQDAQEWAEDMMDIYEDERTYKIVEE